MCILRGSGMTLRQEFIENRMGAIRFCVTLNPITPILFNIGCAAKLVGKFYKVSNFSPLISSGLHSITANLPFDCLSTALIHFISLPAFAANNLFAVFV